MEQRMEQHLPAALCLSSPWWDEIGPYDAHQPHRVKSLSVPSARLTLTSLSQHSLPQHGHNYPSAAADARRCRRASAPRGLGPPPEDHRVPLSSASDIVPQRPGQEI